MISENKIWSPIQGYENLYEINRIGDIRSLHKRNSKNIINKRIDRGGYYTVRLSKQGVNKTFFLHRLLALTFMVRPEGKCCINHLDGNKLCNDLNNLAWVTTAENVNHAYSIGLIKRTCRHVIDACTNAVFTSVKQAAIAYSINRNTLRGYLNGGIKTNPTCLQYVA